MSALDLKLAEHPQYAANYHVQTELHSVPFANCQLVLGEDMDVLHCWRLDYLSLQAERHENSR